MVKNIVSKRGTTLPELVVTMAIALITLLAASSILTWVTQYTSYANERATAQQNLMLAAYRIKQLMALAINVGNKGATNCNAANPALQGGGCVISSYNIAGPPASVFQLTNANCDGTLDTLARFYREGGVGVNSSAAGGGAGATVETAIFFRRPDVVDTYSDGTYPSGALYISSVTPGSGIPAGSSSEIYDHLTSVSIQTDTVVDTTSVPALNRAKAATITLVGRYFYAGSATSWLYCPAAQCGTAQLPGFQDETVTVNVDFINNVLFIGNPNVGDSRVYNTLFGNVYFFQMQLPPALGI